MTVRYVFYQYHIHSNNVKCKYCDFNVRVSGSRWRVPIGTQDTICILEIVNSKILESGHRNVLVADRGA